MAKRLSRAFLWPVVTIAASFVAVSTAQSSKSVWTGVYTEAQATAGEAVYRASCAECHGDELAGIEQAPALAGGTFRDTWNKATLKKLFEQIESMPPDEPKSLTAKRYTDVLAYLLMANELPAGATPLAADRAALADITFSSVRPQP